MLVSTAALIPAYKPDATVLPELVQSLSKLFACVVVVDDGSGAEFEPVFTQIASINNVILLRHHVNLGKGAALRLGLNHLAVTLPQQISGVVTLDADGQHCVEDAIVVGRALAEHPEALVLGCRKFSATSDNNEPLPLRSRLGNIVTRNILKLMMGRSISDTQTGLRGIPREFIAEILPLRTRGYDFELDMLLLALRKQRALVEVPISTLYHDGNATSHFNPLLDSFKVYMVFLRFSVSSLLTFLIDFSVFSASMMFGYSLELAICMARLVAGTFNFVVNRSLVFKSSASVASSLIKYLLCVIFMAFLSYVLTLFTVSELGINVYVSKIISETALYFLSFLLQRSLVFHSLPSKNTDMRQSTDWNRFYNQRGKVSSLTARLAFTSFLRVVKPHMPEQDSATEKEGAYIIELGGANSVFYHALRKAFPQYQLVLIDKCASTATFERQTASDTHLRLLITDLLEQGTRPEEELQGKADLVFSFGLIEHFLEEDTRRIIARHFELAKAGGLVFLSFPTQTFLYKTSRYLLERCGLWPFHDERPLDFDEVRMGAAAWGTELDSAVCHRLGLSQGILLYKKEAGKE